jgi:hypothetical protein
MHSPAVSLIALSTENILNEDSCTHFSIHGTKAAITYVSCAILQTAETALESTRAFTPATHYTHQHQ